MEGCQVPKPSSQRNLNPTNSESKESSPWRAQVSAFRSASDTRGAVMTLLDAVRYATGPKQKQVVLAIRKARKVAADKCEKDGVSGSKLIRALKKATENLKRGLWGFTPTGVYEGGRKREQARGRTGAVMVEADHLGGTKHAREAVQALADHPNVMAAWVSPSGDGIKVLVWVRGGEDHRVRHAYATEAIFGVDGPLFGVDDDKCYRNEHLLCFGSYDPDAHIRTAKLKPLVVPEGWDAKDAEERTVQDPAHTPDAEDEALEIAEICRTLAHIPPECRQNPDLTEKQEGEARDEWIRIGMGIHSRMPGDRGLELWDRWSRGGLGASAVLGEQPDNYDERALRTSWNSFNDIGDDGVSWATVVRLSRQWETANAARVARSGGATDKAPDEEDELSPNPDVLELVHYLVRAYYSQDHVMVRATGERTDSKQPPELAAKRIAVEIRTQFRMQVATGVVQDAIEVEGARLAGVRRETLVEEIVGAPNGTDAGREELRKWLTAVAGAVDPLDEAVLLHILRNVKLKLLGREAADHKALILFQLQRSGKSTAIMRLLSPLQELVYSETSLKKMTDERGLRRFGKYAAIVWDEMAGARGRDVDEHIDTLKTLVTSPEVTYRPMATNTDVSLVNTATLFGSTNRPVADIIKDPTGNRRFWQITTLPHCDWEAINSVDYHKLWSAIGIRDRSPLQDVKMDEQVMARHTATRYKDSVEQWVDSGEWGPLTDVRRPGSVVVCDLDAIKGGRWYATADLYARFLVWCAAKGFERTVNEVWFGRRLASLGWASKRTRIGGEMRHAYEAPCTL